MKNYLIGTEIETNLNAPDCATCSECLVCDDCPICYDCQNADCEKCEPCQTCEYVFNADYCPIDVRDYYILPPNLKTYFLDPYIDGSCGLEFPTRPFDNLSDYYYCLLQFIEEYGRKVLSVKDKCGGHINISFTDWQKKQRQIYNNALYFLDILTYMFLSEHSVARERYHNWPNNFINTYDKYSSIHFKDYAIEFRFPDAPYDATNHTLLSAILLSISLYPHKILYSYSELVKTRELYERFKVSDFSIHGFERMFLNKKFKKLMHITKSYLQRFSRELHINLVKLSKFRFENPAHCEILLDEIVNKFNM